uniref:KxDL domain-containing protein n=1 Tax=Brassica campestris TaxID=3711 RepID=A0A3P5Z805_BRACM|nr:unnamed protein product [Brassica rapa]
MEEPIREASQQVSEEFKTLVDAQDLNSLRHLQHLILGRLQDSNAVLSHYNDFAESCFADVSLEFSRHTRLLKSMKADLDYIFLKLRFYRRQPQDAAFGRGVRRNFLRQRNEQELTQNVDAAAAAGTCGNQTNSPKGSLAHKYIKSKIMATYPDAFPDESTSDAFDRRPDLELPQ